jgi:hypothetical protein
MVSGADPQGQLRCKTRDGSARQDTRMRFVGCSLRPTPSACHTGLSGGFWISVTDRIGSLSRWVAGKTRSGGKVFPPLWCSQTAAARVADCLCLYPGCGSATECGGCFGFVVRRFRTRFGARGSLVLLTPRKPCVGSLCARSNLAAGLRCLCCGLVWTGRLQPRGTAAFSSLCCAAHFNSVEFSVAVLSQCRRGNRMSPDDGIAECGRRGEATRGVIS